MCVSTGHGRVQIIDMTKKILALSSILLSALTVCSGQAGILDSSFGANGVALGFDSGSGFSVIIQEDEKIVVGGSTEDGIGMPIFSIVRFLKNGVLDAGFENDGKAQVQIGLHSYWAYDIAIQGDGKIVAVGTCLESNGQKTSAALVRLDSNGVLDGTFDSDGKVIISFNNIGYSDFGYAVTVQSDGKIILAGSGRSDSNVQGFAVARLNSDGTLDGTFGNSGKILTSVGNPYPWAQCIEVQPDGKILVGGYSESLSSAPSCFSLVRYNTNGTLDNSFGVNGKVTTYFGGGGSSGDDYDDDQARAMALQPDGKIIMTGHSYLGFNTWNSAPLARYNSDGTLDNTFGDGGKVNVVYDNFGCSAKAIVIQEDGKIVIAGSVNYNSGGSDNDFMLSRYKTDGALDSSFGINGLVITSLDSLQDNLRSIALQDDGKIVVSGESGFGFTVARYISGLNVGTLDLSLSNPSMFIYPNPIQLQATLQYTLINEECLNIYLYNLHGQKIQTFLDNESKSQGEHNEQLNFDESLPSGNYILSISNSIHSQSIKIIIAK